MMSEKQELKFPQIKILKIGGHAPKGLMMGTETS